MTDERKQIEAELKDIEQKQEKFGEQINTDEFNELEQADKDLIVRQHQAMTGYRDALNARIARFDEVERLEAEDKAAKKGNGKK